MTESDRAVEENDPAETRPAPLKDAVRQARIEMAERTGVVVDLRNAELARLQMLNDALDSVFADVPREVVEAYYRVRFGHLELVPDSRQRLDSRLDDLEAVMRVNPT